jgi:hypothetical protein
MKNKRLSITHDSLFYTAIQEVYELNLSSHDELILDKNVYPKPILDKIRHNCKADFNIRFNDKGNLVVRKK